MIFLLPNVVAVATVEKLLMAVAVSPSSAGRGQYFGVTSPRWSFYTCEVENIVGRHGCCTSV